MKYKIGFRTIKTALAVYLAVMLGQFYQLEFYVSSAIITILCVQTTKKKSLKSATCRFATCMLSIPFTFFFFEGIGYYPIVIGVLLLFFIPVTVVLNIKEGVVTSTVIILHIYTSGHMTWSVVFNEVLLIIIGIGSALIVNLYMPSLERKLQSHKREVDANLHRMLSKLAEYFRTNQKDWTEEEIKETMDKIKEAKSLAYLNHENHLSRCEDLYYQYFSLREKQVEILVGLIAKLAGIHPMVKQRYYIADFIELLAVYVNSQINEHYLKTKLKEIKKAFKRDPLPVDWETFEARAQLLLVLKELDYYLSLGNKDENSHGNLVYT